MWKTIVSKSLWGQKSTTFGEVLLIVIRLIILRTYPAVCIYEFFIDVKLCACVKYFIFVVLTKVLKEIPFIYVLYIVD